MGVKKLEDEFPLLQKTASASIWQLKPLKGKTLIIKGVRTLGTAVDADIVIEDKHAATHHARLTVSDEGIHVEDLGSKSGTYLNGKLVTKCLAKAGDHVRFGSANFELQGGGEIKHQKPTLAKPAPEQADIAGPQGTMMISENQLDKILPASSGIAGETNINAPNLLGAGALKGQRYEIKEGRNLLGRDKSNDIVIDDASVSSVHAEIINNGGACKVINLLSSNGTFINGKKSAVCYLKPGDKISLGGAKLVFDVPHKTEDNTEYKVKASLPSWIYLTVAMGVLSTVAFIAIMLL